MDVSKNSSTATSSNEGEFDTVDDDSCTEERVSQSFAGDRVHAGIRRRRDGLVALSEEIRHDLGPDSPVPPMTTTFMMRLPFVSPFVGFTFVDGCCVREGDGLRREVTHRWDVDELGGFIPDGPEIRVGQVHGHDGTAPRTAPAGRFCPAETCWSAISCVDPIAELGQNHIAVDPDPTVERPRGSVDLEDVAFDTNPLLDEFLDHAGLRPTTLTSFNVRHARHKGVCRWLMSTPSHRPGTHRVRATPVVPALGTRNCNPESDGPHEIRHRPRAVLTKRRHLLAWTGHDWGHSRTRRGPSARDGYVTTSSPPLERNMTLTTQPTIRNYTAGTWSISRELYLRSAFRFATRWSAGSAARSRRSAASLSPVRHHSTPA